MIIIINFNNNPYRSLWIVDQTTHFVQSDLGSTLSTKKNLFHQLLVNMSNYLPKKALFIFVDLSLLRPFSFEA